MKFAEPISPFSLHEWVIEPEFHQISQGETCRRLEPKVMSVLLRLAAEPRRVVSKREILQAVWPDTFVGEDALTRCISLLRHALEDDPQHPRFIRTVSKVGYCLLVEGRALPSPVLPLAPGLPSPGEQTPACTGPIATAASPRSRAESKRPCREFLRRCG